MRARPRPLFWLVFLLLPLAAVAVFAGMVQPARPGHREKRDVFIARGTTLSRTAARLEREGFIRDARAFRLLARFTGRTDIISGHHPLSPGMSSLAILTELERVPEDRTVRLTFPEGFTLRQAAERAGTIKGMDAAEVERLATTAGRSFEASFPLPGNLEGYLFPDTYEFDPSVTPREIVQRMVTTFDEKVVKALAPDIRRSAARGYDLAEIVTLASLIEREARVPSEQARIAGVLYNRLERGMPLQVDATVQYVIGHRERLLFRDLEVDSPYNTYKVTGLPPGAICNPGLPAIRAALNPERGPWLYYVAKADGSHTFTTNFNDHNRAAQETRRRSREAADG